MKTLIMTLFAFFGGILFSFGDVTVISAKRAAAQLKKDPETVVVDLRTPKEFAKGHIKGAINLDLKGKSFAAKLGELDRQKTYVMHCRSGSRSSVSVPIWNRLGFQKVLHLTTGTVGWVKAGEELVKK